MKNIIYFDASDAQKFDFDRFKKSINSYAKVSDDEIKAALKDLDNYENLHVSRLVETGAALIAKNSDIETAQKYIDNYEKYFGELKATAFTGTPAFPEESSADEEL